MYLKQKILKYVILIMAMGLLLNISATDAYRISELTVTREDEDTGKSIFTVHILPGETQKFDKLKYIITYHQDFPFEDSRGRKYHKIHEPAVFTYERKKVKLVEDLDNYINFRVPISRERLKIIYGKLTFHPKFPITIPSIKICAYDDGEVVWEHDVKINKSYVWDEKKQNLKFKPPRKKKKTKK